MILGGNAVHTQQFDALGAPRTFSIGLQSRAGIINGVGLFKPDERVRYATVRRDDVRETSNGIFTSLESRWTRKFRRMVGACGEVYTFDVA